MSKKPASLTSDLLARKGEAEPLSIDPSARMSLFAGPDFAPGGGSGQDDERPRPPEPEIIYTAEETSSGRGSGRLVIGAVLGAIVIGGVLLTLSSNTERGVAPVSSDLTANAPVATPPSAPVVPTEPQATAPVAPQTTMPETAAPQAVPQVPAPEAAAPQAAPTAPSAPAAPTIPSAPDAVIPQTTAPALRSGGEAPAEAAPAAEEATTPAPAAPAKARKAAAGGAYVVQISALRDERSARTAWAQLGKRFPAVLGGHALDIEKADLGAKGTYYRVRAAGFTSKAAAQSACSKLKAGGQDCMVKKR